MDYRLEDMPYYEFAEQATGAAAPSAAGAPNAVKIALNGETGEFSTDRGAKANDETMEAVLEALKNKHADVNNVDKKTEEQKKAVEDMKKGKDKA